MDQEERKFCCGGARVESGPMNTGKAEGTYTVDGGGRGLRGH